eukprot:76597-Amphidinium_carterae.2
MPNGAVRKGAKHSGGKLTITSEPSVESSSQAKQHRQKLRKATQRSSDELLDALIAEQLQGGDGEGNDQRKSVAHKPLAIDNFAFHEHNDEEGLEGRHESSNLGPAVSSDDPTIRVPAKPMSFSPLRDATGSTCTPRVPESEPRSSEPTVQQPIVSE